MPSNTLSHQQMSRILREQFREVEALGFTAEGVVKVHQLQRTETTFVLAAKAISQNSHLIKDLLITCPSLKVENLQHLTRRTGKDFAEIIQTLHDHRGAIRELTATNRFSGANMSGMLVGSGSSTLNGIRALIHNKEALVELLDSPNGFSAGNIASMLNGGGSSLGFAIQELSNTKDLVADLIDTEVGFSANNIACMLTSSVHRIGNAIRALHAAKPILQELIRSHGFSVSNLSSILHGSRANIGQAITDLYAGKEVLSQVMRRCGFSAQQISYILKRSGAKVKLAIEALDKNSPLLAQLIQSGQFTTTELAFELRSSGVNIGEAIQNNAKIAKARQAIFFDDLSDLLFGDQTNIEGIVGPGIAALVHHRATLLQLKQVCGFSANHIAGMLKGSEADIGTAIGELSRKKFLLFGLIQEGLFTADELADKLHGSGVHLGEVFDRNPDIRLALHASVRDEGVNALGQDDDWLDGLKFFEVDDAHIPVISPASQRPRLA